jgi:hypothetical protein
MLHTNHLLSFFISIPCYFSNQSSIKKLPTNILVDMFTSKMFTASKNHLKLFIPNNESAIKKYIPEVSFAFLMKFWTPQKEKLREFKRFIGTVGFRNGSSITKNAKF